MLIKCLAPKGSVTVIAESLDGGGARASKVLRHKQIEGQIEATVLPDKRIKGTIKIVEYMGLELDTSKSKFVVNTSSSKELGSSSYESGLPIDSVNMDFCIIKPLGTYFVHALIVSKGGQMIELVSDSLITDGICFDFDYKEFVQQVELDEGNYKIEAWGAQGGSYNSSYHGGYGGYSTGKISIRSKTTLFVVVGKEGSSVEGGYNGGGHGGKFTSGNKVMTSYGGGGASHVGLKSGLLSSFSNDYRQNLLLAAGGGGGAVEKAAFGNAFSSGGCGGGSSGAEGSCQQESSRIGKGATQNSGGCGGSYSKWSESGKFGQGGNSKNEEYGEYAAGGGGGGFYGGGSGGNSGSGGGGSGYINTSKLTESFMFGYNVAPSSSTESKTNSTTNFSTTPTSNYAKQGNGFVWITPI